MKNRPLAAVIMSVYNGMPYLETALKSALAQTVRDIEVVVTDDGSTDGSRSLLAAYARQDRRVRMLVNDAKSGQSLGLNKALLATSAPWVAVLDADDVALPARIERQLEFVSCNSGLKAAGCLSYYINSAGGRIGRTHHDLSTLEMFRRYMERGEAIGFLHSGAFLERQAVEQVGGYRTAFEPANDCDLWNRLSEIGPILVQQEYLAEYRVHGQSLSAQSFLTMRTKYEWIRACMRARRQHRPEPLWEEFLQEWNRVPPARRANRWRKFHAKRYYRQAGLHYAGDQRARAAIELLMALVMQPGYALPHLRGQRL